MAGLNPYGGFDANPYGFSSSSKNYAGDNYTALTRDMWAQWTANFLPFENKLIEFATDPTAASDAMAQASSDVNASFDAQQQSTQRRLRGLGLKLDADEQAAVDNSASLSRSLADVTAQNVAGTRVRQQQNNVLGNPVPVI